MVRQVIFASVALLNDRCIALAVFRLAAWEMAAEIHSTTHIFIITLLPIIVQTYWCRYD